MSKASEAASATQPLEPAIAAELVAGRIPDNDAGVKAIVDLVHNDLLKAAEETGLPAWEGSPES